MGWLLSSVLSSSAGDTERIKGCWDSIHVVEVQEKGRTAHYKLTSTVMLWLQTIKEGSGMMNLGGSLTRQVCVCVCVCVRACVFVCVCV